MYSMVGMALRETGQALDRLGCRVMGNAAFKEQLNRHRTVMNLGEKIPGMTTSTFVAPSASVIGDVTIGPGSSIWYGSILRGDVNKISIGAKTNIQDGCVVHVAKQNMAGVQLPTIVGSSVTVGHGAVLHACTVEDNAFVGMGATLLDGSKVEKGAMVAAGALVTAGTTVPTGQIWAGNPAKFLRNLTTEESAFISVSADNYASLAATHLAENSKPWEQVVEEKAMRKQHRERSEDYDSHLGVARPSSAAIPA
jgi:carbonic anhydrase/acetyltransferase-like protein (isoleucine patch superfamily)